MYGEYILRAEACGHTAAIIMKYIEGLIMLLDAQVTNRPFREYP